MWNDWKKEEKTIRDSRRVKGKQDWSMGTNNFGMIREDGN